MNYYVDMWGRYHDKPVKDRDVIPSNNGWIYTAYAEKYGLDIDWLMLGICFKSCKGNGVLLRSPAKFSPPISRDEILGMAALGFLKPEHLNGWNFSPYPIPKFNLIKTIKQLLELRGKHRNYLWQNGMDQVYRFAFSVPLVDRHFILTKWGKFNILYWAIAKVDSLIKGDNGIYWLKYGKGVEIMQKEFPEDHPLRG